MAMYCVSWTRTATEVDMVSDFAWVSLKALFLLRRTKYRATRILNIIDFMTDSDFTQRSISVSDCNQKLYIINKSGASSA